MCPAHLTLGRASNEVRELVSVAVQCLKTVHSVRVNNCSSGNLQALWLCESSVWHVHFFWFLCYFTYVCLSSGPLSFLLLWLPQRRRFPPVVCKLLLNPAPLQQVICPSCCLTAGAGQACPAHHPFPFTWARIGKWIWRFGVIYPPPCFPYSWLGLRGNKDMTGHSASCPGA